MELTAGQIVHVRNNDRDCRPAIVVRVWKGHADGDDSFNGVVFRDGSNDRNEGGGDAGAVTAWVTSVAPGDGPHEYHDPRECPGGGN